jgi:hypothetical protein
MDDTNRPELKKGTAGTHKEILSADQRDVGNQVISVSRSSLSQSDKIGPIFYTTNPVGMGK